MKFEHIDTLPETNSLHPKMDAWNTTVVSFWVSAWFQVRLLLVLGSFWYPKEPYLKGDTCSKAHDSLVCFFVKFWGCHILAPPG